MKWPTPRRLARHDQCRLPGQVQEAHIGLAVAQHVAVGALQRRTRHHDAGAPRARRGDPRGDRRRARASGPHPSAACPRASSRHCPAGGRCRHPRRASRAARRAARPPWTCRRPRRPSHRPARLIPSSAPGGRRSRARMADSARAPKPRIVARREAGEQRRGQHRRGTAGLDRLLHRPAALPGIADAAGIPRERRVLRQRRGGQVEQPGGDDRAAPPDLRDVREIDGDAVRLRAGPGCRRRAAGRGPRPAPASCRTRCRCGPS